MTPTKGHQEQECKHMDGWWNCMKRAEHIDDEAWVYAITYDHNSKHYPFEIILAEKSHDLLSFHSADYDNAERFLCYNEDLVRDFYMMPRKEDEK